MTITARNIKDELKNTAGLELSLDIEARNQLIAILNRALNTWPEAPADWKGLADYLVHGRILQQYVDEPKKNSAHSL